MNMNMHSMQDSPLPAARRRTAVLPLAALLLAALVATPPASATVLQPLDVDTLAGFSQAVVHARVLSTHVEWNDAVTMPITIIELEILEVLDGSVGPRARLLVTTPGGAIDGIALDYAGRPRFTPGTETVVFLTEPRTGSFIPVGLVQGTLQVGPRLGDGRRLLRRNMQGAKMAGSPARPFPTDLSGLKQALQLRPRELSGSRP